MTTVLPYLNIVVDVKECKVCREIYLEQGEILLSMDDQSVDNMSGMCRCHSLIIDDASGCIRLTAIVRHRPGRIEVDMLRDLRCT